MSLRCVCVGLSLLLFKQKTAYERRISDWSSDVCSSGLNELRGVDRVERQSVFHTFFIRNQDDIAVDADQLAVETLAPVALLFQRDLRFVPRPVGELGAARQRPVDAGRRNLQPVGGVDRVLAR